MSESNPSLKVTEARGAKAIAQRANALQRMVIEYVDVDSIKPNAYNPNVQTPEDFALLLRSMKEDGFTQPIVVQKATREIVDGEHRWRAGRQLGLKQVPVVFVDMLPGQQRISTFRHNRARGSEDHDLSVQILKDLRELGVLDWAQDVLMIDDAEMQKLIADEPASVGLAGEEFNEAWTPSQTEAKDPTYADAKNRVSFTPAAKEMQARFGEALEKAETREERYKLEMDSRKASYRVFVTFKGDDAAKVRARLEPNPAVALFDICKPIAAAKRAEVKS